jgi:transketolase
MPCASVFERQDAAYRDAVLPRVVQRRVAVEAGSRDGWWKYVGLEGRVIGIDHFGASAPAKDLFARYGFTADNVRAAVVEVLSTH